jgi:hypothetical protein
MNSLLSQEFEGLNAEDDAFWLKESRFQKQAHWLRHSFAVSWLGRPEGLDTVINDGIATCGPISFSAITGCSAREALLFFPHVRERPWTNRTQMERALFEAGFDHECKHMKWPTTGLCLIQITGPWTERRFEQAALKHTHWVAVLGEYVFDINWGGWLPRKNWEEIVMDELLMYSPGASGWRVHTSYELPVDRTRFQRVPRSN